MPRSTAVLTQRERDGLQLGRHLVEQLRCNPAELLSAWLADYIHRLMGELEHACEPAQLARASSACMDAILKLWEHRSVMPPPGPLSKEHHVMDIITVKQSATLAHLEPIEGPHAPLSDPPPSLSAFAFMLRGAEGHQTGIWEATPGRFQRCMAEAELMHILAGEARFTPAGASPIETEKAVCGFPQLTRRSFEYAVPLGIGSGVINAQSSTRSAEAMYRFAVSRVMRLPPTGMASRALMPRMACCGLHTQQRC